MVSIKTPKFLHLSKSRFGQIIFTVRETLKLVFKISPGYLIAILIANTIWGFSSLPSLYLDKLILDQIVANIGNQFWQDALRVIVGLLVLRAIVELLRNLLSRLTHFLSRRVNRIFSSGIEILIGEKLQNLDIATLENIEFKNRFNKIEEEMGRTWGLIQPLSNIPNYLSGFVGATALLILVSPWVALTIIIISLPQFFIDSRFIKKEYSLRTELSPLHRLWGWLSFYLIRNSNFQELKILNLSPYLTQKSKDIRDQIFKQETDLAKSREIAHSLVYVPTVFFEVGLYIWLVMQALIQKITIGSLQMYISSFRSAQMNLTGLVSSFLEIYENYLYVVDLIWLFSLQPLICSKEDSIHLERIDKEIRFENVWFRYRDDTPWILKNINLVIKPGEKLAIVGENGAGKSTLIKLLARFYDPQKGNIFVGDINLKDIDINDWHKKLAILFQKFELYPFTARESIGYGDTSRIAEMEEIKASARRTGIDEYIENLPLKYENPLDVNFEKGINPSIGQAQRVGISRMLFRKNADLLILDEPTSNVDPKAEEDIFNNLTNTAKDKILIFISQRFSTVRIADEILVIDDGKITEKGTHQELMKLNKTYASLFNLQAKGYL